MDNQKSKVEEMELAISNYLRIGVVMSAIIVFVGLIMLLISGRTGYTGGYYPTSPGAILRGFVQFKPYAVILTGLLVLILTPVFRVGVSIILFIGEKDYLYVKITTTVFIILIISFILGKVE